MTTAPSSALAAAYSTDVEGGVPVMVRMHIAGAIGADYLRFVMSRAHWLGIAGWARTAGQGRVEVVAAGPEALVGALEMACILGPLDTLVDDLRCEPLAGMVPPGFVLRS
jgi:acylphosphatase